MLENKTAQMEQKKQIPDACERLAQELDMLNKQIIELIAALHSVMRPLDDDEEKESNNVLSDTALVPVANFLDDKVETVRRVSARLEAIRARLEL